MASALKHVLRIHLLAVDAIYRDANGSIQFHYTIVDVSHPLHLCICVSACSSMNMEKHLQKVAR